MSTYSDKTAVNNQPAVQTGKAAENPLHYLDTKNASPGNNPLAALQDSVAPAQLAAPQPPWQSSFRRETSVIAGKQTDRNITGASIVLQPAWRSEGEPDVLVNREQEAVYGIVWFYNASDGSMELTVRPDSPHYRQLRGYEDMEKTYGQWLALWRRKGWLPGGAAASSDSDSSDGDVSDDEGAAVQAPMIERPLNYNAHYVPYGSPRGTVGMNDFISVNDADTTLSTGGFAGCVGLVLIGPGNRRTLVHILANYVDDYLGKERGRGLIDGTIRGFVEGIREAATGATVAIFTDSDGLSRDGGRGQMLVETFGLTGIADVRFHGRVEAIHVRPDGQYELAAPAAAAAGAGAAAASTSKSSS